MPFTLALTLAAATPVTIPGSEVIDLPRAANGAEYQLYVQVPPQCADAAARCPAVFMLDAANAFPLAATIATHLGERQGMHPAVMVGIGYRDKGAYRPNRTRDYTPWPVEAEGNDYNYRGSGRAAGFRAVLRTSIIPFIEARYHTDSAARILVGHSYGGLFAVDTLLADPGLFGSYLIVSPSLWYANGRALGALRDWGQLKTAPRAQVYLAVGALEEQPGTGRPMVSQAREAAALLSAMGPGVTMAGFDVLPGESHASVFPAALSNGLRRLLPIAP